METLNRLAATAEPSAHEVAIKRLLAAALSGSETGSRLCLDRIHNSLRAVLELCARDPVLARTAIVDALAAGPESRRPYWRAVEELGRHLDACMEAETGAKPGRDVPENLSLMAIGSVCGLISDELQAERVARLPTMLPDLLFVLLVPYLGPTDAAVEMHRARAQRGT